MSADSKAFMSVFILIRLASWVLPANYITITPPRIAIIAIATSISNKEKPACFFIFKPLLNLVFDFDLGSTFVNKSLC